MRPCCRPVARGPLARLALAVVSVAILALVAWLARGDDGKVDVAGLIRQLGHDDFERREAASRRLAELGEDVLPQLKAAGTDRDAEVRRRAGELVAAIERKLFGELTVLVGHGDGLWSATFSPDGTRAATCSDDKSLRLWDLASGRELGRIEAGSAVNCARFFRDGKRLLVGLADGNFGVYDVATGGQVLHVGKHAEEVIGVELLPGETEAVTVSRDRTLKRWDIATPKLLRTCDGHTDMIRNVAVTRDGRRAATASFDGTVRLWDLDTGELLHALRPEGGMAFGVGFSPDGRQIATGTADHHVRVWDVASGEELSRLEGHTGFVYSTAFSADGRRLLSACEDRSIRVWDLAGGKTIRSYQGHDDYVRYVELAPDGRRFLTASKDRSARLWNVPRE